MQKSKRLLPIPRSQMVTPVIPLRVRHLVSIRSSDIAFTMGAKGPLLEKAHNYNGNIERY